MTGLDYFTFLVLGVLVGATLFLAFVLGGLPGRIAARRDHPNADAIRVAGWLGLLTLGLLWPLALIWAYTRPLRAEEIQALRDSTRQLAARVERLEESRSRGGRTEDSGRDAT